MRKPGYELLMRRIHTVELVPHRCQFGPTVANGMILILRLADPVLAHDNLVITPVRGHERAQVEDSRERDVLIVLFELRETARVHVARGRFTGRLEPFEMKHEDGWGTGNHVPLECSLEDEMLGFSTRWHGGPDHTETPSGLLLLG